MSQCLIPGCPNDAPYYLGIRLRRPGDEDRTPGTAIWAPNLDAYLCEDHAAEGYEINIQLTLAPARTITTNVSAAGGPIISRTTPIKNTP